MANRITVLLRQPERLPRALATAGALAAEDGMVCIVFFCPGCIDRKACGNRGFSAVAKAADGFTDCREDCIPEGFRYAETSRIARVIRESDLVVPV